MNFDPDQTSFPNQMPPIVPHRFLVRIAHPCPRVAGMPLADDDDHIVDLPEAARLRTFAKLDGITSAADVRLAWNEFGIGIQMSLTGKDKEPIGDASKPSTADGLTIWIDTRSDRTSHRASRYCHQFHLLPSGGGPEKDEASFSQSKINRAAQDAPIGDLTAVPFRLLRLKKGYRLEALLPAALLTGFDPEQYPQLGVYYQVRDSELGNEYLGVNADFPFADDPSLWDALDLVK